MAQTIKLKRSATSGAAPTTSQLELGEVAINTYDGKMYIKKNVGGTESIVEITGGSGGSSTLGGLSDVTISSAAADQLLQYNGSEWVNVSIAEASAIMKEYQFTATSGQSTFSGSDDNSETLSYTAGAIQVFLNGIFLDSAVDYTATNGTSIVLSETVDANDYLQVVAFKKKIGDGNVSVDTFTGNGSTTAFTLSVDPGDENNTRVFVDGVYQSKSNYSVSGTTLTFSTAPPADTAVEVEIGNRVVTLDTLSDLDLPDDVKLRLGTSQDADFYHDGTDTYLRNQTGQLLIRGNDTKLQSYLGETYATFANNGAATLYYDNSAKLATTSSGITVTGTAAADAFTFDNYTLDNNRISTNQSGGYSGDIMLDAAGDIILDADSGAWRFKDNGGSTLEISTGSGTSPTFYSPVSDADIVFKGNDGGSVITALTLDMSASGAAIFNDQITLGGNLIHAGNLTIDAGGDITLDAAGNDIILKDSGTTFGQLTNDSGNLIIYNSGSQMLKGLSTGSNAQFMGNVGIGTSPASPLHVKVATNANFEVENASGTLRLSALNDARSVNVPMQFVSSSFNFLTGNVGIGTTTPSAAVPLTAFYSATSQFHIGGAQAGISNNVYYNGSAYTNRNTSVGGALLQIATDGSFAFRRATSGSSPTLNYSMYIDSLGKVGIGTTTPGKQLTINGADAEFLINRTGSYADTINMGMPSGVPTIVGGTDLAFGGSGTWTEHMRLTSIGRLGIGTTSPRYELAVQGNNATAIGIAIDNTSGSGTVDLAILGANYNSHQAGAGEVWLYSPDNINIGGATGNTNNIKFLANNSVNMFIQGSNGNVGIGTTSPESELTIEDDDATLRIRSATTTTKGLTLKYNHSGNFGQLLVDHQGNNQLDMKYYALTHKFGRNDSSQFVTIDDAGRLLVGSTTTDASSSERFLVKSTGGNHSRFVNASDSFTTVYIKNTSTTANTNQPFLTFQDTGGNRGNFGLRYSTAQLVIQGHGGVGIAGGAGGIGQDPDLFVNNSGNVGIGTSSPGYPLEISGPGTVSLAYQRTGTGVTAKKWGFHSDNSNTYWQNITDSILAITVSNAGNVGIGKTNPLQKLNVHGKISSNIATADHYYGAWLDGNSTSGQDSLLGLGTWHNNAGYVKFFQSSAPDRLAIYTSNTSDHVTLQESGGKVGIGTTNPQTALHIFDTPAELLRMQGNDEYAYASFYGTVSSNESRLGYMGFANDTGTAADFNFTNNQSGIFSFNAGINVTSGNLTFNSEGQKLILKTSSTGAKAEIYTGDTFGTNRLIIEGENGIHNVIDGNSNSVGDWSVYNERLGNHQIFLGGATGNVGIGTTVNEGRLHVLTGQTATPPVKITRGLDGGRIQLQYATNTSGFGEIGQIYHGTGRTKIWIGANLNSFSSSHNGITQHDTNYAAWAFVADSYSDEANIQRITTGGAVKALTINSAGKVGIGTDNPQHLLDTAGTIRHTSNIVSNTVYKAFSIGSNRSIDDYGGLNKDYWAIQLATPGANTDGGSSAHGYGALKFSGVSGSDTTLDDVLVLNYNGRVGIGTSNPAAPLQVSKDLDSGGTILHLTNADSTYNQNLYVKFNSSKDIEFEGASGNGGIIMDPGSRGTRFQINSVDIGRFDSDGLRLEAGKGIKFSAHASGNILDDYEEGSWNPTLVGNSGASGQSYNIQNGYYTKIGSFVHATFDVQLSTLGTLSGTYVVLGGLPFAGVAGNLGGTVNIGYSSSISSNIDFPIAAYISGSNIYLMETGVNANYILIADGYLTNSTRLIGSIIMYTNN